MRANHTRPGAPALRVNGWHPFSVRFFSLCFFCRCRIVGLPAPRQTTLGSAEVLNIPPLFRKGLQLRPETRAPQARQHRDSKLQKRSYRARGLRHNEKDHAQFPAACQKATPFLQDRELPYRLPHLQRTEKKPARNPEEPHAQQTPAAKNADAASVQNKVPPGLSSCLAQCPRVPRYHSQQKLFPAAACLQK